MAARKKRVQKPKVIVPLTAQELKQKREIINKAFFGDAVATMFT